MQINTAQSGVQKVKSEIQEITSSLSRVRQKMSEAHLENDAKSNLKESFETISSSKQQFHHLINEYFKDLADSFVILQGKYPNKEVQGLMLKKIDSILLELDGYSQKMQHNQFTQSDQQSYQSAQYGHVKDDIIREVDNLQQQLNDTPSFQKNQLPQVKVNHRVVEGLYLTLNEYASVYWPGELEQSTQTMPQIEQAQKQTTILAMMDEQHQQVGIYDVVSNSVKVQQYTGQSNLDYQPTCIVVDSQTIYYAGGITNTGHISGQFNCFDTTTNVLTKLPDMMVKRSGASGVHVSIGPSQYIYIVGGKTDNKVKTKLCERYNIGLKKWEQVPKLNNARAKSGIAVLNQCIYVFFGIDSENQNLNVVEKLDLEKSTWEVLNIQNYLPGFDVADCSAIAINEQQILIYGGIRYSVYFPDQMYFNRKIMAFNSSNDTFAILDHQIPLDFIPISTPIIHDGSIYTLGCIMKQVDDRPQIFLDGGFIIKISKDCAKMIKYIPAFHK